MRAAHAGEKRPLESEPNSQPRKPGYYTEKANEAALSQKRENQIKIEISNGNYDQALKIFYEIENPSTEIRREIVNLVDTDLFQVRNSELAADLFTSLYPRSEHLAFVLLYAGHLDLALRILNGSTPTALKAFMAEFLERKKGKDFQSCLRLNKVFTEMNRWNLSRLPVKNYAEKTLTINNLAVRLLESSCPKGFKTAGRFSKVKMLRIGSERGDFVAQVNLVKFLMAKGKEEEARNELQTLKDKFQAFKDELEAAESGSYSDRQNISESYLNLERYEVLKSTQGYLFHALRVGGTPSLDGTLEVRVSPVRAFFAVVDTAIEELDGAL